jgi:hypothetical protein
MAVLRGPLIRKARVKCYQSRLCGCGHPLRVWVATATGLSLHPRVNLKHFDEGFTFSSLISFVLSLSTHRKSGVFVQATSTRSAAS